MSSKLKGKKASHSTISLYAALGSFKLPNADYTVKYGSTFANPSANNDHKALLDQLLPMRDRLESDKLDDLSALLQRDLNDDRVANELVPYLRDAKLSFFPSILAILAPKGYLRRDGNVVYPKPSQSEGNQTKYEDYWQIENYEIGDEALPLGRIIISRDLTDVIVLDGQHRCNAFRYISGSGKPQSIYSIFYNDAGPVVPNIDSDLPITLAWFESKHKIEPIVVSRKLFVDVNNNAKAVSKSRTYLLDDQGLPSIIGQAIYQAFAQKSFSSGEISLLHTCFDADENWESMKHLSKLFLTVPDMVVEAIKIMLLGGGNGKELANRIERERNPHDRDRLIQFYSKASKLTELRNEEVVVVSHSAKEEVSRWASSDLAKAICYFYNEWNLTKEHFKACLELETFIQKEGSLHCKDVWKKAYKGGEGLYWAITRKGDGNEEISNYKKAIAEIEKKFSEIKKRKIGLDENSLEKLDRVVNSFAFTAGLYQAMSWLIENSCARSFKEASNALVGALNKLSFSSTFALLSELKSAMITSTSLKPKDWTVMRDLLIRTFENAHHKALFSDMTCKDLAKNVWPANTANKYLRPQKSAPEYFVFSKLLCANVDDYIKNDDEEPDWEKLEKAIDDSIYESKELFKRASLKLERFNFKDFNKSAKEHLLAKVQCRWRDENE